jgi:hypothetical protein
MKVFLPLVEGTQPLFFLLPPLMAPELKVLLGRGQGIYWVSMDMKVDFLGEVSIEEMLLCLRNVVRICHSDVVDSIKVLTWV